MIIIGFLAAIFVVFVLVLVTIKIYFLWMRKRKVERIVPLNVKFIIFLFLLVLLVHVVCVQVACWNSLGFNFKEIFSNTDWIKSFEIGFEEIYNQLGGLTFEGQEFDYEELGREIPAACCAIVYFCTILYLAVMDAILIVIGVSYPIYSRIRLRRYKQFKKIFIFTSASEESLALANDIRRHLNTNVSNEVVEEDEFSEENDESVSFDKDNADDYVIIFAGDEIGPYDKDNKIHYRISENDYLYVSLNKIKLKDAKRSLIQRLFSKKLKSKKLAEFLKQHEVSIFSLATDDKGKGFESKNSDLIFDDIGLVLKSLSKDYNKNGYTFGELDKEIEQNHERINYYVLSNNEINFEFYEESVVKKYVTYFKNSLERKLSYKELPPVVNLSVLNEAVMSAEDLVRRRHKNIKNDEVITDNRWINYSENGTRVLVIGFGFNGQKALDHFFSDCVGGKLDEEDEKYIFVPNKFSAEIIDQNMDKLIESYIVSHPSYVFLPGQFMKKVHLTDSCYENHRHMYAGYSFSSINKYLAFPLIFYRNEDYNSDTFIKTIDKICEREYDSVIIALGDDEKNIECANNIFKLLRQSFAKREKALTKKLQIFINIRDANNNGRLLWNKIDKELTKNVFVYRFGNINRIYSCDAITDFNGAARINRTYEEILGKAEFTEEQQKDWEHLYLKNCSLFEKKTNAAAFDYGPIYSQYLKLAGCETYITQDYNDYKELRKDTAFKDIKHNGKSRRFYKNDIEFLEKAEDLVEVIGKKEQENGNEIGDERFVAATLANYERIKAFKEGKDLFLAKNKPGYYWRYLIQFDHYRWCRHMMMYGRSFTKVFEPQINDDSVEQDKNDKYWKNRLLLHDCLLPYSSFNDYKNPPVMTEYLNRSEEDYDYGVVVAALELDKNS